MTAGEKRLKPEAHRVGSSNEKDMGAPLLNICRQVILAKAGFDRPSFIRYLAFFIPGRVAFIPS
jgi:hypothetical protein